MKVGSILKAVRQRSGLSQEELAHTLHINQSDISKFENDTKEPTINIFRQWMMNTQAQEVMIAYLCGVDGVSIMQNIMDLMDIGGNLVSTILLGGLF